MELSSSSSFSLLVLLCLVSAAFVPTDGKSLATASKVKAETPVAGRTCGTPSYSPEKLAQVNLETEEFIARECHSGKSVINPRLCSTLEERKTQEKRDVTRMLVAHHVIYDPTDNNKGNLTQKEIDDQMDRLNIDYAGSNFQFDTYTITRTGNTDWFTGIGANTQTSLNLEVEMTYALAVGLPYVMQVYWVEPAEGILGFAYLPASFSEDSADHCIVMHYATVPGGSLSPYNLGKTLTHEMGHALGLQHTFQGGCTPPGDSVSDTNYVEQANYGCPSSHFSCGSSDPVDNFMDYVNDACMDTFTAGQMQRMDSQVGLYRPSLLSPEDAPAPPPPSSASSILPGALLVFLANMLFALL